MIETTKSRSEKTYWSLKRASFLILLFSLANSMSGQNLKSNNVEIQFSDGRSTVTGIESVNAVLKQVGVRTCLVDKPKQASDILKSAEERPLSQEEKDILFKLYSLNRAQLVEQVKLAGRTPEGIRGGYLSIKATNGGTYPRISDFKTTSEKGRADAINKFGKLHVNMSDAGMGIDETMTILAGGRYVWFFVLPDGVVTKVTAPAISNSDKAFRISYPGMLMHAGYFPTKGVTVAYAHGPQEFTIRFEESAIDHSELLNTNPWIDFTSSTPKLLDVIKK